MKGLSYAILLVLVAVGPPPSARAATILYDQDFENPAAFVNDGGDVNIDNAVNALYGNQPPGFVFTQAFTVETLLITGTQAFGTGYSDPSGIGGNYAVSMLSDLQNDLLGLAFNVSGFNFLNARMTISSIDLSVYGGPFVPVQGAVPNFQFTLYDNPSGTPGLGAGTILDMQQAAGTASAQTLFDWTTILLALDASGNTNGNVILQIDLLTGGYAALDNFRIAASDTPGDVDPSDPSNVPEAPTFILLGVGLSGLFMMRRRIRSAALTNAKR